MSINFLCFQWAVHVLHTSVFLRGCFSCGKHVCDLESLHLCVQCWSFQADTWKGGNVPVRTWILPAVWLASCSHPSIEVCDLVYSPAQSDLIFLMRRRPSCGTKTNSPVDCNTGELAVGQSTGRKRGRSQVCPTRNYSKTSMTRAHCKHAHSAHPVCCSADKLDCWTRTSCPDYLTDAHI